MSTEQSFAYLAGSCAAMFSQPFGWLMSTPAGWALVEALVEAGGRP